MPFIHLTTFIAAPADRVFDLSRSVALHKRSMDKYGEQAINGKTSGLMDLGDTVTWKAKHVYKERVMAVKITSMQRPFSFTDEQIKGDFKLMKHEHFFKPVDNGTIMIDHFHFEIASPFAKWINAFYLTDYMTRLLEERNAHLKSVAEGAQWQPLLVR
jgi:ligand-binding SRPBCC domain-containing protein